MLFFKDVGFLICVLFFILFFKLKKKLRWGYLWIILVFFKKNFGACGLA
jgi:hypothetical protein